MPPEGGPSVKCENSTSRSSLERKGWKNPLKDSLHSSGSRHGQSSVTGRSERGQAIRYQVREHSSSTEEGVRHIANRLVKEDAIEKATGWGLFLATGAVPKRPPYRILTKKLHDPDPLLTSHIEGVKE